MNCSPPGSSIHGILQARILEWVPFPSSGDLPKARIKLEDPSLAGGFLTSEQPGNLVGIMGDLKKNIALSFLSFGKYLCSFSLP